MTKKQVRLQVGVVGAGIAGLAAAIALSRSGHSVEIFERSRFKNEVGAAIIVGPNGTRILDRWGFDFDEAGAVENCSMRRVKADTLEADSKETFVNIEMKYGHRWPFFHRADLHSGLRELVENFHGADGDVPAIRLSSPIVDIDCESGTLKLDDGRAVEKDLVVIADGAHSQHIEKVNGIDVPVTKSPMSMYRFLVPFEDVLDLDGVGPLFAGQPPGFVTFYKAEVGRPGLLFNTYPCRNGELLYCALLHPTKPKEKDLLDWNHPATCEDVVQSAQPFHPGIRAICAKADDVNVYTQMFRNPIDRFTRGKAVLIGDAAHLMLPTHGQGASMAIEDAAALEILMMNLQSSTDVISRLELFDKLRLPRVRSVQTMSNKMLGPPDKMIEEIRKYFAGSIPGPKAKTFSPDYCDFFFHYDVAAEAAMELTAQ